jgi:hypothetical protein
MRVCIGIDIATRKGSLLQIEVWAGQADAELALANELEPSPLLNAGLGLENGE